MTSPTRNAKPTFHYPRQGSFQGKRVIVAFNYETANAVPGKIVRDDTEDPYQTVIVLDDGRAVLATECQYAFVDPPPPRVTEAIVDENGVHVLPHGQAWNDYFR